MSMLRRFKPYPAYKDSGAEWLGEIPTHWEVRRLKYGAELNPSPMEARRLSQNAEVSFVPMEAVGEYGGMDLSMTKQLVDVSSGYTYFADGDVVVAKITPCFENRKGALAAGLANGVAFGTTELHVLRALDAVDRKYLFYISLSDAFRRLGAAEMYGAGGQKRVPEAFVENLKHPLPPAPEQRAIAAFLDRETDRIDGLVAKNERLIELLREKRTALITCAVTKGLDPNVKMKDSGVEWLGEIPAHWEVKMLKRLGVMRAGVSITAESIEPTGEYPVYGGNGIRGYTTDFTHEGQFPLVGRQGALCGCVNFATGRFWASEHAVVVSPNARINPHWLAALIQSMALNAYSQSAAQPGLAVETIGAVYAPHPPEAEQGAIAEYLEHETTRFDTLIVKVCDAINHLKEYRTALVSAAVTGKIDVREPTAGLASSWNDYMD